MYRQLQFAMYRQLQFVMYRQLQFTMYRQLQFVMYRLSWDCAKYEGIQGHGESLRMK
jgi:hypothetical protein